jgi:hypothetical protein
VVNFDLSLNMDVVMAPLPRNGAAKQGKRHLTPPVCGIKHDKLDLDQNGRERDSRALASIDFTG